MSTFPNFCGPSGVATVSVTPPNAYPDGLFWFNPVTKELAVSLGGQWNPVAGGGGAVSTPEVHVGTTAPTGTEKIWIDTTIPAEPAIMLSVAPASWTPNLTGGNF